jgi:hypothetical protein
MLVAPAGYIYHLQPSILRFFGIQNSVEMSNIIASSIAISCGYLATYHTDDSLTTFSYLKAAALSILIYVPIQFTWTCFLWPLYFSPLRKLPQAPVWFLIIARNIYSDIALANWGWKSFFSTTSPPKVLEFMDTVPHEHFFRMLDIFNKEIVILTDPKAITQPFQTDSYEYVKPMNSKRIVKYLLGNGLVVSDGQDHKVRHLGESPCSSHFWQCFSIKRNTSLQYLTSELWRICTLSFGKRAAKWYPSSRPRSILSQILPVP